MFIRISYQLRYTIIWFYTYKLQLNFVTYIRFQPKCTVKKIGTYPIPCQSRNPDFQRIQSDCFCCIILHKIIICFIKDCRLTIYFSCDLISNLLLILWIVLNGTTKHNFVYLFTPGSWLFGLILKKTHIHVSSRAHKFSGTQIV